MLLFPQLLSGAIAQYPLRKSYALSNVTNLQEDGSRYRSGATNPADLSWTLNYTHLSQQECDSLSSFFRKTSGRAVPFTFLDPFSNLLSWSEDLSQPIWDKSASLSTFENRRIRIHRISVFGLTGQPRKDLSISALPGSRPDLCGRVRPRESVGNTYAFGRQRCPNLCFN